MVDNSVVRVNDIFDELRVENARLANDLSFANTCLDILRKFKIYLHTILAHFDSMLDSNQRLAFTQLMAEYQRVFAEINNNDSNVGKSDILSDISIERQNQTENQIQSKSQTNRNAHKVSLKEAKLSARHLWQMVNTCDSNEQNKAIKEKDCTKRDENKACMIKGEGKTRYKCDWSGCDYITCRVSQLKDHKNRHIGVRPYKCVSYNDCDKSFFTRINLLSHEKIYHKLEKTYVCESPDCNKKFKTVWLLNAHKVIHRDERPFACDHSGCQYRTKTKGALALHSQTHLTIKTFKCPIDGCDRSFKTEPSVRAHAKYFHTEYPLFKCDFLGCDAAFRYRNMLVKHKFEHSNVEPPTYSCEWPGCDYRTSRSDGLRNHKLIHFPEKNHVCDWKVGEEVCGKRFRTSKNLYQHIRIHKNDKRHVCHWPGCQYRCVDVGNMKKHLRVHNK